MISVKRLMNVQFLPQKDLPHRRKGFFEKGYRKFGKVDSLAGEVSEWRI